MPIIRSGKSPHIAIERKVLEDPYLSWEAKGVYSYLQSISECDDEFIRFNIPKNLKEDEEFCSFLNELIIAGYLEKIHEKELDKNLT